MKTITIVIESITDSVVKDPPLITSKPVAVTDNDKDLNTILDICNRRVASQDEIHAKHGGVSVEIAYTVKTLPINTLI